MKFISLLRGINVSGRKQIPMRDLKSLYEQCGLRNVVTYIQSGNVIFDAEAGKKNTLKPALEAAIEKTFRFRVPVLIRSQRELADIIRQCPFTPVDSQKDGTKVLVTFLDAKPSKTGLDGLLAHVKAPEQLIAKDRQLYLYCPNGYGKSKLANTFVEKKLGIDASTRNWNSVCKLYELSQQ